MLLPDTGIAMLEKQMDGVWVSTRNPRVDTAMISIGKQTVARLEKNER
jgi:hypothetical protein